MENNKRMNTLLMNAVSTLPTKNIFKPTTFEPPQAEGGNILPLISERDPRLKQKSEPYDFVNSTQEEREQLVLDLGATMRYNKGLGLSAVQVGIMKRIFVLDIGEALPLAFFNPVILKSEGYEELEEGCLSYPNVVLKIGRSRTVRVRFKNFNNEVVTHDFDGMSARCILHEISHLDGITMQDEVSKLVWDRAIKRRKKLHKFM